jgi:hypothetical protein
MYELPITLNNYIVYDDYAILLLEHKRLGTIESYIDIEDIDKCRNIYWTYNSQTGYVEGGKRDKKYSLQRFVMNTPKDMITDHIDGNKLNNRKSNLRFVTPLQSQYNTNKIGVNYRKDINKYRAYIVVNGTQKSLGVFNTYEEACLARKEAEEKYFGEFRRTSKFDFLK